MQDILIRTREVLAQADTTMAIVLAGVAVVAILLIVGAAVFIVRMYTPKGRLDLLLESRAPERATNPWITRGIVILTVALVVVGTTLYAERPQSCMTCHQDAVYSEGLAEDAHASVTCAQCHRSSGVTGRVDDTVRYAGWLWSYYLQAVEITPGTGAFVDSRTCLRCHGAILDGVIETSGVRVRHSDFIEGSTACVVCHGDVGHAQQRGVQVQPVMNSCMACHDGETASSACAECHVQDLGVAAVARRGGQMNTVGIRQTDCYGCHPVQGCNECHGITMPHEPGYFFEPPPGARQRGAIWVPNRVGGGFPPGSHARDGFVNRELCWRCHFAEGRPFERSDEGCWCHGLYGFQHGGPAWVREHGLQATGQKTGTLADCGPCHGPAKDFCTFCHPESIVERYAPRVGPDNYTPSPGWPRRDPFDPDW